MLDYIFVSTRAYFYFNGSLYCCEFFLSLRSRLVINFFQARVKMANSKNEQTTQSAFKSRKQIFKSINQSNQIIVIHAFL